MKKLLLLAIMMTATMAVSAQNDEGEFSLMPKVGINIADHRNDAEMKSFVRMAGGLEIEYGVNDNVGLSAGLLYSAQGSQMKEKNLKINLDYINVPLLVHFYPVKGLALKAGAQLGFITRKKMLLDNSRIDLDMLMQLLGISAFNNFDLSIPVGISYEIERFVIDARYNFGLTDVYKDDSDHTKNSVFQFTLGYKFEM